jgi:hypothetical protein
MKITFAIILFILSMSVFGQTRVELDSITRVLERVYESDQEPRQAIDSLGKKFGYGSFEMTQYWKEIGHTDSLNTAIVTNIINTYGWLSAAETSEKANSALFLVIQHADIKTRERYLAVLRKAVEQGKAKARDYAYLLDRTLMDKGKFQIFGTQLTGAKKGELSFYPIADEKNVNKRRKEIGLQPIEEYAKGLTPKSYVLPKTDLYRNKFVIIGTVLNMENQPLANAGIYFGDNRIISNTDDNGIFKLVLDKKYKNWAFIIRKEGYKSMAIALDNNETDVYTVAYVLSTQ